VRHFFDLALGLASRWQFPPNPRVQQRLGYISLLVRDYDEAIAYYTNVLGFRLLEDTPLAPGKRWVLVAPLGPGAAAGGACLLLARAKTPAELAAVGNQSGGRVFLFLHTDNFARDHAAFLRRGVEFIEEPRDENYGTVAVFRDLYGNKWDLLQLRPPPVGSRAGS
jgi:catechol 2,3-dioxygenase-like lactoylglutathione lyase family enzyme